jgi:hypothetical protein
MAYYAIFELLKIVWALQDARVKVDSQDIFWSLKEAIRMYLG